MFFYYLLPATIYSAFLLFHISQDEAGFKRPVTWVSLTIATILWPLVFPISVWEITKKNNRKVNLNTAEELALNKQSQTIAGETT